MTSISGQKYTYAVSRGLVGLFTCVSRKHLVYSVALQTMLIFCRGVLISLRVTLIFSRVMHDAWHAQYLQFGYALVLSRKWTRLSVLSHIPVKNSCNVASKTCRTVCVSLEMIPHPSSCTLQLAPFNCRLPLTSGNIC